MTTKTLTISEAEALIASALERSRTHSVNAAIVAKALVAAEADGLKGHGLSRVPTYAAQARNGKVDGAASPRVEHVTPALALMVEILAAGLTGATYAADATSFLDDKGGPPGTGQLLIAFDPKMIGGPAAIAHFGRLASQITGQKGARLPGSRRISLREKAKRDGLSVAAALVAEIEAL